MSFFSGVLILEDNVRLVARSALARKPGPLDYFGSGLAPESVDVLCKILKQIELRETNDQDPVDAAT